MIVRVLCLNFPKAYGLFFAPYFQSFDNTNKQQVQTIFKKIQLAYYDATSRYIICLIRTRSKLQRQPLLQRPPRRVLPHATAKEMSLKRVLRELFLPLLIFHEVMQRRESNVIGRGAVDPFVLFPEISPVKFFQLNIFLLTCLSFSRQCKKVHRLSITFIVAIFPLVNCQ